MTYSIGCIIWVVSFDVVERYLQNLELLKLVIDQGD
jgi:hypothetical protein